MVTRYGNEQKLNMVRYFYLPLFFLLLSICGVTCSDNRKGPVLHLPFNGNADNEADTTNNGIVYGPTPVADRNGNINAAYSFDGIDDYITLGGSLGNFGYGDFTFALWCRTDNTEIMSVIGKWPICGHGQFFTLRASNTYAQFEIDGSMASPPENPYYVLFPKTFDGSNSVWRHFAFSRKADSLTLYIDGVPSDSTIKPVANLMNTAPLYLGFGPCVGVDGTRWFKGDMDEVYIYNRALSNKEIRCLMDSSTITTTDSYIHTGITVLLGISATAIFFIMGYRRLRAGLLP